MDKISAELSAAVTSVDSELTTSSTLVQKFLMEPFFGFNNGAGVNTEIYTNAGYTAQGMCHAKLSTGEEYLFVAQRPRAFNYLETERHRIVQFPFLRDGTVAPHIVYSAELNIGHSGGLSAVVNPDDTITLYSWQVTDAAHTGDDSGKGFSKIEWDGSSNNATTQSNVTSYQVFGYNSSTDPRSAYRHIDCSVDHTGSEIAFIGYKRNTNSDEFLDQTVFIFDLPALLSAADDAARMRLSPKEQWVHPVPFVDRGMYKQGIAIRNGVVAVISGFTNPMVPETISFYDRSGNLLRREQPTNNRAIYGLDNLLDNPTLGTPMQFEPEGLCFIDDSELIFMMMDQWRLGASVVTLESPVSGASKNYSRIATDGDAAPSQVDTWCETRKAATDGAWSAGGSYTIGTTVSRRSKMIHSLKVPTGETGEIPLSAGMYSRWARMAPISSYENAPNTTFKAENSYQIHGYCYPMAEFFPAAEFVHGRTSSSSWRIHDLWSQAGPNFQMTYRSNGGREFGGVGFATGTGGLFFYTDADSSTPGEFIVRNRAGGGFRVRSGTTGAFVTWTGGTDLGESGTRWGTGWFTAINLSGNATVGGTLGVTGASTFTAKSTFSAGTRITPVLFSTIGTAAAAGAGTERIITDSSTVVFNATATGGGANFIKVRSDGTSWKVC